jgi:hypothetical protein
MTPNSVSMRGWVVGTFVAGAAIGWFWAAASSPGTSKHAELVKTNHETAKVPASERDGSPKSGDAFSRRLEKALANRNGTKRARAINEIADGLNSQQIRAALDDTQKMHVPSDGKSWWLFSRAGARSTRKRHWIMRVPLRTTSISSGSGP